MVTGNDWDFIISRLQGVQRPRVWSVIITIFGDAVVPRGGAIPLQALQEIMGRLCIEAGALRTALSRLASEGWVQRERHGRLSHYSIDTQGLRSFDEATQRIYAPGPPEWDNRWTVAIPLMGDDTAATELAAAGFVSFNGTWLRPETFGARPVPSGLERYLVVGNQPGAVPEDAWRAWNLDGVADAVAELVDNMAPLAAALEKGAVPPPLEAIALRTLVIHEWRRIVLRAPSLPVDLLPPGWPALQGRGRLGAVYSRLVGPSEAWLDGAGLPPQTDPAGFAARFGGCA